MNDTQVLAMLVGFAMIGGSIFSTAFVFGAWRNTHKVAMYNCRDYECTLLLSLWGYSTM